MGLVYIVGREFFRTGKTFLLFQKINMLIDSGIKTTQILYINFEDDRLLPMDSKKLSVIVDEFYTLFPENHKMKVYLFFDEIKIHSK